MLSQRCTAFLSTHFLNNKYFGAEIPISLKKNNWQLIRKTDQSSIADAINLVCKKWIFIIHFNDKTGRQKICLLNFMSL